MLAIGNRRNFLFLLVVLFIVFFIFSAGQLPARFSGSRGLQVDEVDDILLEWEAGERPRRKHVRTHVAVASLFGPHFDVYVAAAGTIREILGNQGHVDVFAAQRPFMFKFQEIIDRIGLFPEEVRDAPEELLNAMNDTNFYPDEPGAMIDLLIVGTCEIDMRDWSDRLLEIWDSRPEDKKFRVVCIVHNYRDTAWQGHITSWAARSAIRLLPIADHVGRTYRNGFQRLADDPNPEFLNAMYEYIPIDVHVPVLDLPDYGVRSTRHKITRAIVQGNFELTRRDYDHIFQDLLDALKRDPGAWGYLPLGQDRDEYLPTPEPEEEPFTLHLAGNGNLDVPPELKQIIKFHRGLDYPGFYGLMQSMDIVLPAFVNYDYYDNQASSTVVMAVECDIPLLVTKRTRKSYGYIDDDRVTVTRPQALREIPAIEALRAGTYWSSANDSESTLRQHVPEIFIFDVNDMLRRGWKRSHDDVRSFKEQLWRRNRKAVANILDDLPGSL